MALSAIVGWLGKGALARVTALEAKKLDIAVATEQRMETLGLVKDITNKMDAGFNRVYDKMDDLRDLIQK